jgi:hypothetical protein
MKPDRQVQHLSTDPVQIVQAHPLRVSASLRENLSSSPRLSDCV